MFTQKERKHTLLKLLHFSVQSNDRTVNPRQWSPKKIRAKNNEQSRGTDTKK